MRVRVRPVVAALLGLSLALAGCSSSTSGQAAVATSATLSSSSPASDTAVLTTGGTSDSTSSDTGSSDSTDTSDSSSSDDTSSDTSSSDDTSTSDSTSTSEDTDTSIPSGAGFNTACLSVATTYAAVSLSLLSVLSGTGTYNGSDVLKSLQELGGSVPDELKPAFATLTQAVQQANGKSGSDATAILQSDAVTKATDTIKTWVDKNCAG